jgi:hypothetical protein
MVPSWTETLIACGVDVVGRTSYCIHPGTQVADIPIVGGTKDVDWNEVADTGGELLLLDKEENTKDMAAGSPLPVHASHVNNIPALIEDLRRLAAVLGNSELSDLAGRWQVQWEKVREPISLNALPGVMDWVRKPLSEPEQFVYLIWRKPWMAVSHETFIGSMFECLGLKAQMWSAETPYPKIDLESYDKDKTLLLCSSEPYPFERKRDVVEALGFPAAIVDGECFSWFGIRSLQFLEGL